MVKCKDCNHHIAESHRCSQLKERSELSFPADTEVVCPNFKVKETEKPAK